MMMCDAVILHSIHVDGNDDDRDAGSRMVDDDVCDDVGGDDHDNDGMTTVMLIFARAL